MTFREQLKIIRNIADGALINDNIDRTLDRLDVRQQICDMLYTELVDLEALAETGDGNDK